MPRELTRTKPEADLDTDGGGLEEFAPRKRPAADESPIGSGWSIDKRRDVSSGDRMPQFKVPEDGEEILLAFLQDKPFAPFYQHWVKAKRRGYVCLGKGCPMCAVGDKPKPQDWFNVIEMGEEPVLKVWFCSADPAAKIKARADNKRTTPINREGLYWAASKKKGANSINEYSLDPVKEDELSDWGVSALTEAQKKEFLSKAYTSDRVKISTKPELQEVVDECFA